MSISTDPLDRIKRRFEWLVPTIEAYRHRPLAYGTTDCFQFAAEIVQRLTGVDYRPKFPTYASHAAAREILAAHGGAVGLLTSVLGEPTRNGVLVIGDLVAADFGGGVTVGVAWVKAGSGRLPAMIYCTPGPQGLACIPSEHNQYTPWWSIPWTTERPEVRA